MVFQECWEATDKWIGSLLPALAYNSLLKWLRSLFSESFVYSGVDYFSLSLPCGWLSRLTSQSFQAGVWAGYWWKGQQKATGQICLSSPKLHHMSDAEENSKKYQARQSGMVRKLNWKHTENIPPCVSSSSLCTHRLLCVNSSLLN